MAAVAAKPPDVEIAGRATSVHTRKAQGFWTRRNKQAALIVLVVALAALWFAVSLLFELEIQ